MQQEDEYAVKKKAIFDSMSKRGQQRILRIGYDNWEPFEEPKDPRERIFGSVSVRAGAMVQKFYRDRGGVEESVAMHKELFELCRGLLQEESRAKTLYDFFTWFSRNAHAGADSDSIDPSSGN